LFRWAYRVSNIASCITGSGRRNERAGERVCRCPFDIRTLMLSAASPGEYPAYLAMSYLYERIYLTLPSPTLATSIIRTCDVSIFVDGFPFA